MAMAGKYARATALPNHGFLRLVTQKSRILLITKYENNFIFSVFWSLFLQDRALFLPSPGRVS
jgi:hypothetical protein